MTLLAAVPVRRALQTGMTVLATTLAVTVLGPAAVAQEDPALDQRVASDEATVTGRAVVEDGHVDLGPRFIDGEWRLQARDDRQVPPVWRFLDDLVFQLPDAAVLDAPASPDYAFLGVESGAPLYVVPQTQAQEVVWLGWYTQDPEVTQRIDRGATLTLEGVDGPGEMHLFLQEGVTGPPNVLWSSGQAYPQDLYMEVNTHVHANWVFTEPGVYLLDVRMHADLVDGGQPSDTETLAFAVGDTTDPEVAFTAASAVSTEQVPSPAGTAPAPEASTPDEPVAQAPAGADGGAVSGVLLGAGAGGLALLAIVAWTVLRARRTRERALVETGLGGPA